MAPYPIEGGSKRKSARYSTLAVPLCDPGTRRVRTASRFLRAPLVVQRRREPAGRRTVWTHGLGEDRAASGVRRLRRPVAPGREEPPAEDTRRCPFRSNRLSLSRGAAGGASPERTVWTHGLGEDRAASGVRRLRRPVAPGREEPPAEEARAVRRPGRSARALSSLRRRRRPRSDRTGCRRSSAARQWPPRRSSRCDKDGWRSSRRKRRRR